MQTHSNSCSNKNLILVIGETRSEMSSRAAPVRKTVPSGKVSQLFFLITVNVAKIIDLNCKKCRFDHIERLLKHSGEEKASNQSITTSDPSSVDSQSPAEQIPERYFTQL